MSNNIIGLSHLVFTVPFSKKSNYKSSLLELFYSDPIRYKFDHYNYRKNLLKSADNNLSNLEIYIPKNSDSPAIELLYVNTDFHRPNEYYGFIFNKNLYKPTTTLKKMFLSDSKYYVEYYYDLFLHSNIATNANLFASGQGCWISVNDFVEQKKFFSSISGVQILVDENSLFVLKCRVLNKTFSFFYIAIIPIINSDTFFYNDNIGISTFGWFRKNNSIESYVSIFKYISPFFQIEMTENTFDAIFLSNNKGVSHELLKTN